MLAIVGVAGFAVFRDEEAEPPVAVSDDEHDAVTDGADDAVSIQDDWSVAPDGDDEGSYILSMIRTFSPMDEADVDDVGGHLVWPETEVELCDVHTWAAGDGFVQIGVVTPTTEGCPGMLPAFVEHGLPDTACLFVTAGGVDDEHCAPLAAG